MKDTVRSILAKYENRPPPDDYPCYGDTIEFTDELNGRQYTGIVIRHHWASPIGTMTRNIWDVQLIRGPEGEDDGKTVLSVRQPEITKIIRKKD